MADRKLLTLVERLHRRTQERKVQWGETPKDGVFQAEFGGIIVTLQLRPDPQYPEEPDYIVRILNDEGRLVEQFTNNDLSSLAENAERHPYRLMSELYDDARRLAMGVDRALDTLLNELND